MHDGSALAFGPATVRLATYRGIGADCLPRVEIDGSVHAAQSLVPLADAAAGAEAAVVFVDGDAARPLVLGLVRPPERVAVIDGRREVVAERELVLRCGPASIRLTANGRITIRGTRILSRADGPNRVQGAMVELN